MIFDFDGVIAESVSVKTNAFAELYNPFGDEIVKKVVKHHEANGGMSRFEKFRYYHNTFLNKSISEDEVTSLADQFSGLVIGRVIDAPYVPGALEFIEDSYNKYKLFISTGTPTEEIKQILIGRNIEKYFTEVFGSPDNKNIHMKSIFVNYGFKPSELIFYGDSSTDLVAATNAKIPFVLIKNCFNQDLAKSFNGDKIESFLGQS